MKSNLAAATEVVDDARSLHARLPALTRWAAGWLTVIANFGAVQLVIQALLAGKVSGFDERRAADFFGAIGVPALMLK